MRAIAQSRFAEAGVLAREYAAAMGAMAHADPGAASQLLREALVKLEGARRLALCARGGVETRRRELLSAARYTPQSPSRSTVAIRA